MAAILVAMLLTITLIGFSSCTKYEAYNDPYTTILRFIYDKAKDQNTMGGKNIPR
mgnify:CR=1 FL=1